ncbi:MAG: hypothetical protein WCX34_07580, partial [Syntrophales bacterium]
MVEEVKKVRRRRQNALRPGPGEVVTVTGSGEDADGERADLASHLHVQWMIPYHEGAVRRGRKGGECGAEVVRMGLDARRHFPADGGIHELVKVRENRPHRTQAVSGDDRGPDSAFLERDQ